MNKKSYLFIIGLTLYSCFILLSFCFIPTCNAVLNVKSQSVYDNVILTSDNWLSTGDVAESTTDTLFMCNGSTSIVTMMNLDYDNCVDMNMNLNMTINNENNSMYALFMNFGYLDEYSIVTYVPIVVRSNDSMFIMNDSWYAGFDGIIINDTYDVNITINCYRPYCYNIGSYVLWFCVTCVNFTTDDTNKNMSITINELTSNCTINVSDSTPDDPIIPPNNSIATVLFSVSVGVGAGVSGSIGIYTLKRYRRV